MLKKFSSNSKRVIYLSALQMFMIALSGIFLNIFIIEKTSSGFWFALYNLFLFTTLYLAFYTGSKIASKKGVKKILLISFVLYFLWLSLMILFTPFISEKQELIIIVGLIAGLANGLYWAGMNSLKSFGVPKDEIVEFTGTIGSANSFLNFLAPVISTLFLFMYGDVGYLFIFALSLIVILVGFILSLKLENYVIEEEFRIKDKLKLTKDKKNNFLVMFCFVDNIRGSIFDTIIPIILLATYHTDQMVGVYTAYSGLVAIFAYLIGIKVIRMMKSERLTVLAYVALFISSLMFAVTLNPAIGFVFATINNIATPIIIMITWTIIVEISRPKENEGSRFYASMTVREFYSFAGRFIGTLAIVLLGYKVDLYFQYIYVLSELLLIVILFLVLKYQWSVRRDSE